MNRTRHPFGRLAGFGAIAGIALPSLLASSIAQAVVGPTLAIDANAGRHPISPDIYGMVFEDMNPAADEPLAKELKLPMRRFGGNIATRYNWKLDVYNHGDDWFFESLPNRNPHPENLPDGSTTDRLVEQNMRTGTRTYMAVPLIGWTPKSRRFSCSYPRSLYGDQTKSDTQWHPDCGNGVLLDGTPITWNKPTRTDMAIGPEFVKEWLTHLTGKYGKAGEGGVAVYALDNEPMLWSETHRDVHPEPATYDEVTGRGITYARAIKEVDPTAKVAGPTSWGWTGYFYSALDAAGPGNWWESPQDRLAHGDQPFVEWYLDKMREYEEQNGKRLLDYFDLHFYPQAQGLFDPDPENQLVDPAHQRLRLRAVRALWDPTYVDESWIKDRVRLIPRMREWVNAHYPGTRLSLSEYNFGALFHINGALAQADALGIFGREGLDLATLEDPPRPTQPGAYAFRMYLNYDGQGSRFGEVSVKAASADQGKVSVYAAQRCSDGALTAMVVNKTGAAQTSPIALTGATPTGQVQVWQYSKADLKAIRRLADLSAEGGRVDATFPANSITLLVVPQQGAGCTVE